MYKETDIVKFIDNVIELTLEQEQLFKKKKDQAVPDYNPIYKDAIELADDMAIHMELKKFPEKLFKEKAPNEDPKEFEYRKAIYQPVTVPYMDRAISSVNRIWNSSNYVIKWLDEDEIYANESAQDYFEKKYPLYKSLLGYFKSVVTKHKLKDPNAVLAFKINNLQEDLTIDQTQLVEPVAVIYDSDQVLEFKQGKYALIERREKSLVKYGQTMERSGRIFEFHDTENIWRITQVGKKVDYEFEYVVLYNHALGILPVEKLKGKPKEKEGNIIYESYFSSAIPNLNTAICIHSTLMMSHYAHNYAQRWEMVDDCNAEGCGQGCDPGFIMGGDNNKYACPSCKGTGKKNKHSPLGVIQVDGNQRLNPEALKDMPIPPAGYINPSTENLELSYKMYLSDINSAFAFLNIEMSNSVVKGSDNETALKSKIDREEFFSFLLLFSDEEFDLMHFTIDVSGKMRYGKGYKTPEFTKPVNFSMRSDEELTLELIQARTAQIPDIAIRKLLEEYALSRFNTDENVVKFITLVSNVDRLITLTQQEIAVQKSIGVVQTWEVILHTSIYTFIEQLVIENPKFLDEDFKVMKEKLETMAKDIEKGLKANEAASVDNILAQANKGKIAA